MFAQHFFMSDFLEPQLFAFPTINTDYTAGTMTSFNLNIENITCIQ